VAGEPAGEVAETFFELPESERLTVTDQGSSSPCSLASSLRRFGKILWRFFVIFFCLDLRAASF
jgi:hypothetical protein